MKKLMIVLSIIVLLFSFGAYAVTLEWDAPTTGDPATGYYVYYKAVGDAIYQQVEITDPSQLTLTIPDIDFLWNTDYDFYVTAYNTIGEGGESNHVTWQRQFKNLPGPCILRIPTL